MNAELLVAQFERISAAPDAVARLRKFVLDLAVRGKLVDQDPDDESAEKLMRLIARNRSMSVGRGLESSIRFTSNEPEPFNLPSNWTWARLGSICTKTGSGSTPRGGKSVYQQAGVPFLRSQNVYNDGLRLEDVAYIAIETHERMSGTAVEPGDLLLNITGGSIGRCCLVPQDFDQANVSQHVAIIRVALGGTQHYLHKLVLSPYFQSFVLSEQTGAGRLGLPKHKMDLIPVALPPLSEQHRIVAKVDELMALCDGLEAAQREQENRLDQLTASMHHHLNNGDDADELRNHTQFFIGHLPRLTARPNQIKQLRQTILNLAVRGKLVPQDLRDEPAPSLVRRIRTEKSRLAKVGLIRKEKTLPSVNPGDFFALPRGWAWARWESIAFKIGDIDHKMPETVSKGVPFISPRDFLPDNQINFEGAKRVSLEDFSRLSAKIRAEVGDLIYPRYGTIGENRLVTENRDFLVSYSCAVIKVLHRFVDPQYQYIFSVSSLCKDQAKAAENKTTQANVGIKSIQEYAVPLPPLAEQHRIVAKVNELMALCDQLEASLTTSQTETSRLLESVLHHALQNPALA